MSMIIVWIVAGTAIGWWSSLLTMPASGWSRAGTVAAGVAGALIGGFFIGPMMGSGLIEDLEFSPLSLLASILGSILLVAFSIFARHGSLH